MLTLGPILLMDVIPIIYYYYHYYYSRSIMYFSFPIPSMRARSGCFLKWEIEFPKLSEVFLAVHRRMNDS